MDRYVVKWCGSIIFLVLGVVEKGWKGVLWVGVLGVFWYNRGKEREDGLGGVCGSGCFFCMSEVGYG